MGKIAAQGDLTLTTAILNNSGEIYTDRLLDLLIANHILNEETGRIQALSNLSIKGGNSLENMGEIKGQKKVFTQAHEIQNQGKGYIGAGAELTLVGAIFGNEGETKSHSYLEALLTDTITNKGLISSGSGLNLQSGNILQTSKESRISAKDQTKIRTRTLQHQGIIQGERDVSVTVKGEAKVYKEGHVLAEGNFSVEAKTLDNTGVLEGKQSASVIITDIVKNRVEGKILSHANLALQTGTLDNEGLVQGKEETVLKVSGNTNNSKDGQILSKGSASLETRELKNDGKIQGKNDVSIDASKLKNQPSGKITSGLELKLSGGTVDNEGALQSGGALTADLKDNLLNKELIHSGSTMDLKVDGDINNDKGNMLSKLTLTMRGLSKEKANSIINKSGLVESFAGGMLFKGNSIQNVRERVIVEKRVTARSGDSSNGSVTTTDTYVERLSDPVSKMIAAKGIVFEVGEMVNKHSLIAGGEDVTLNGQKFGNLSTTLQSVTESWRTEWHEVKTSSWDDFWGEGNYYVPVFINNSPQYNNVGIVPSTVQAGEKLEGKFKETILTDNGLKENQAFIGRQAPAILDQQSREVRMTFARFMDAAQSSPLYRINTILEKVIPLEVDQLETQRSSPHSSVHPETHPYIIETRGIYVDPKLFLSSDYFLSRMDIFKDKTHYQKRLGDAFVETQLIRNQIFKATGRYFLKGFTNQYHMMKALYDNAIEQSNSLELSPGLSLSKAQIDRLQKDIIWMEHHTVKGQRVLVPRVYFAKVSDENYDPESGKLLGKEVSLQSKNIHLTDLVRGDQKASIKAEENSVLFGAHVDGGETSVEAGNGLAVLSSLIEGDTVTAKGAQTVLETLVRRDSAASGFQDSYQGRTKIGSRKGDVAVEGTDGLAAMGSKIDSAQDIKLKSGGTIGLGAQQASSHVHAEAKGFSYDQQTQRNLKTDMKAKRHILTESQAATRLVGVDATAGGRIYVKSAETIDSDTVHDIYQESIHMSSSGGGLLGGKSSKDSQVFSQGVNANKFTAGSEGTLLEAVGTISDRASHYKGPAILRSHTEKVRLLSDKSKQFSQESKSSVDIVWQSKSDKGSSDEQVHMVQAPDGLKVEAAKGAEVEIKAQGNLAQSIDALAQMPGTAWVKDLARDPSVKWDLISEAHENWNYKSQGLTPAASAVIALAVTIASGGTASSVGAALAGNTALASTAASIGISQATLAGMVSVGFKTIVSQAAVSLVNNQGDMGKVLKDLGSSSNLRSLAAAVVTAGLTSNAGIPVQPTGFGEHLQASALKSTIGTVVSLGIEGGNMNSTLNNIARGTVAGTLGGMAANEISSAAPELGAVLHKVAHAPVGAVVGAILSDDPRSGAWSGAVGAVVAETVGELITDRDALKRETLKELVLEGTPLTQEVIQERYRAKLDPYIDRARLAGGAAALFTGHNPSIAIATATNAVENNLAFLPALGMLAEGGAAVELILGVEGAAAFWAGMGFGSLTVAGVLIKEKVDQSAKEKAQAAATQGATTSSAGAPPPGDWEPEDGTRKVHKNPTDSGFSKKPKLKAPQVSKLEGVSLKGKNPGNVHYDKTGRVRVDTELLGGEKAAHKFVEKITGVKLPKNYGNKLIKLPNGNSVMIRGESSTGHVKVEISTSKVLEKITFR